LLPPVADVRILADSNIVAQAVRAMRAAGHDVVYSGERSTDPGDAAILAEALADDRVFVTKDRDVGVLVHRDRVPHSGVLLIDDVGDPAAETTLILTILADQADALASRVFLRADGADARSRRS